MTLWRCIYSWLLISDDVLVRLARVQWCMQAELPNTQSSKIIQPLRALKNRQLSGQLGQGPTDGAPAASARLCGYLNDMRELRTKQGEMTAAFKACVPPAWWGTDAGYKSQLGDRFKMCQVQTDSIVSPYFKRLQQSAHIMQDS